MQIDILLSNARVYDIVKADILINEKFSLLSNDSVTETKWFSDNDEVLSMIVNKNNANIVATKEGQSTILIMNNSFEILKTLTIVVKQTLESAVSLNISADSPVSK